LKIYNKGRGVHEREIVGIEKLRDELPADWIAFTNLELALPYGGREIDVILIIEDRILLVDLKDWKGKVESSGGSWSNGGRLIEGSSPVEKVLSNARELRIQLDRFLKKNRDKFNISDLPKVDGCVVLTATLDRSGITSTEMDRVFSIDLFIKMLKNLRERINQLGGVAPAFHSPGLSTPEWKAVFTSFFNVDTGNFRVATRKYGGYQATSLSHCFQHPKEIYSEFDVEDHNASSASGLLRRWDFTKAEARFQNEDARNEIAGRERKVISWLNDRSIDCESSILQPRVDDSEKGVNYWEVYDRRRKLNRLRDLSSDQIQDIPIEMRVELIRQILVKVKILHDLSVPHLDIGLHSTWVETPSIARISHLLVARLPEIKTLGIYRYQFLATSTNPDDLLNPDGSGLQKDVYLLGCVAHYLIFGSLPVGITPEEPAEWNCEIDKEGQFLDLHPWFSRALDWDLSNRFLNAGLMLDSLNTALQSKPSAKQVLEELGRFRTVPSQMKVFSKYPLTEELRDDNTISMWVSKKEAGKVLIKMWKREGWGDQIKETPKILAFLQQAEELILDHPPGCVQIRDIIWTGDSIVLVQDYLDAPTLAQSLNENVDYWQLKENVFTFLKYLGQTIQLLHERQLAHGDLKPENIVVLRTNFKPVLIDVLDYSPTEDGEKISTSYAPIVGGRFERDCFAVTKIAEELLHCCEMGLDLKTTFINAISQIRSGSPSNGTLLPLLEVIEIALNPPPKVLENILEISIMGADTNVFLSDEGQIGLRLTKNGRQLRLRGALEELIFELDSFGLPISGRRIRTDQKNISISSRKEFAVINASIRLKNELGNNFSSLENLLKQDDLAQLLEGAKSNFASPNQTQTKIEDEYESIEDDILISEAADDQLNELVAHQKKEVQPNVPTLWKRLIEIEADLILVGTAIEPSIFNKNTQRHGIAFKLDSNSLEFAKDDTVTVMREERNGHWTKIGRLEITNSTASQLQVEALAWGRNSNNLVLEGQRLRFDSHYEVTSRSRRREATERILSRQARLSDLIDVFDPLSSMAPYILKNEVHLDEIQSKYSLNPIQADAFTKLVNIRPLGLLQGPPGTGKTHFIGALVHYALTHGLAKNVLIASQTHEAVNGAAEAILKLFKGTNEAPSILRVGNESNVSDLLLPYHVGKVENLFKDRFRAEHKLRLEIAGKALAIPALLTQDLIFLEVIIRPVAESLSRLKEDETADLENRHRITGLYATLNTLISNLPIEVAEQDDITTNYVDVLAEQVSKFYKFDNLAKIRSFSNIANLARDFIGSVSNWQRSFEAFLAGTRQIVVGTCVGLGRSSLGLTSTPFDLVIVDEAARCNSGELAVPLQCGRWVVLVGDHFQLEPQLRSDLVKTVAKELCISEREVLRSDFERVFESSYGEKAGATLKQQYRMLPAIGRIVSEAFYNESLIHGRDEPIIPSSNLPDFLDMPLIWLKTDNFVNSAFQKEVKGRQGALINTVEADLIVELIKIWDKCEPFHQWLESQTKFTEAIGIICTYRAQSEHLQQRLRSAFLSESMRATIKVDTVDSYQGKENPIVILSLVRNNEAGKFENGSKTIKPGFMARPNRLNVAISRAMDRLVIVGAHNRWELDSPMDEIVKGFSKQEVLKQAKSVDGVSFRGLLDIDKPSRASITNKSKLNSVLEKEK
jgi:serine/threonine protein kinase